MLRSTARYCAVLRGTAQCRAVLRSLQQRSAAQYCAQCECRFTVTIVLGYNFFSEKITLNGGLNPQIRLRTAVRMSEEKLPWAYRLDKF